MVTHKIVLGHIIEVDFHIVMMAPTVLLCFGKVICAYLVACVSNCFMQVSVLLDLTFWVVITGFCQICPW